MASGSQSRKTFVLVRHGQTDWNRAQRFQGQLDIPLNAAGRKQAKAVKTHLDASHFDAVYSSPLLRAIETAEIIADSVPIQRDRRLTEIHHGSWQGKTKTTIARRWPEQWNRWNNQPQFFTPPGGETAASVRSRVQDFLHAVQGSRVLCVSHGVVIQTFISILLAESNQELSAYVPGNGSIHTFYLCGGVADSYHITAGVRWLMHTD
jgi:probable phosphoglycerate mutase